MQSTPVIGILVSKDFTDLIRIKKSLYDVKKSFGTSVEICQISENFMHNDIKKFILELGLAYSEVLRYDEPYNLNSLDRNEYKFGRDWSPKFYHMRNSEFVKHCDGVYAFITDKITKKDLNYKIIMDVKKKKKNLKIVN